MNNKGAQARSQGLLTLDMEEKAAHAEKLSAFQMRSYLSLEKD